MSAKRKLNAANFEGALAVSALLGVLSESLTIFMLALIGLVVAAVVAGDIRR